MDNLEHDIVADVAHAHRRDTQPPGTAHTEIPKSVCIKIFDGPTFEASLRPRTSHLADGSYEPDGTYLITLDQPPGPGAMRIVASVSQFMHAKLDVETIENEPEPPHGQPRQLAFTLTITGRLTPQGIQSRVRDA